MLVPWRVNFPVFPTAKRLLGLDTPGGEHVFDDTSTGCGQVTSSGTRTHWIFDLPWEFYGCFDQWLFFLKIYIIKHVMEEYKLGGGFKYCSFYFHPYLGKVSILTNIFQMGWFNHQLYVKDIFPQTDFLIWKPNFNKKDFKALR